MLQDKETFVPGKATQVTKIKFTRENLEHDYTKPMDCPIFHALQDAGIAVASVDYNGWRRLKGLKLVRFSPQLQRASDILCNTEGMLFGRAWRRRRLEGKEFAL